MHWWNPLHKTVIGQVVYLVQVDRLEEPEDTAELNRGKTVRNGHPAHRYDYGDFFFHLDVITD